MRAVFTISLFFIWGIGIGQTAHKITSTYSLSFPYGFRATNFDNILYFNAFHAKNGWQLFKLENEKLTQISDFKQNLSKKEVPEIMQGGMISNLTLFEGSVYFFVKGKGFPSGIYRIKGNKTELVYECEKTSNQFATSHNQLITCVKKTTITKKSSNTENLMLSITNGRINTEKLKTDDIFEEIMVVNNSIYGVCHGKLYCTTPTMTQIREAGNYVFGLSQNNSNLWFNYYQKNDFGNVVPYVAMLDKDDKIKKIPHDNSDINAPIFWTQNHGFLMVKKDSSRLYDYAQNGKLIGTFSLDFDLMGASETLGQTVFSLGRLDSSFLYQINGNKVIQQEFDYTKNQRNLTSQNDYLIFLADEHGRTSLYKSVPMMPPLVANQNFSFLDFWQNGHSVGNIHAQGFGERPKLRYYAESGSGLDYFNVDEYSGEISIKDNQKFYTSKSLSFDLKVRVSDRKNGDSHCTITLERKRNRPFNSYNVRESLIFFPDFKRVNTLTTSKLPDGLTVWIYDLDYNMIDEITINNGAIILGGYPSGVYLINVDNGQNLYQKIELK
ncbi:MAG: cadherin repeat domain-containing protein [Flavobacteriales bacterium]|nr:cadherin repeat domain-containing protein [Flavobacteriales bacterium]